MLLCLRRFESGHWRVARRCERGRRHGVVYGRGCRPRGQQHRKQRDSGRTRMREGTLGALAFGGAQPCRMLSDDHVFVGTAGTTIRTALCAFTGLDRLGGDSGSGTSRRYWRRWGGVASKARTPPKKRWRLLCTEPKPWGTIVSHLAVPSLGSRMFALVP